jgi:hypothetical protein
VIHGTQGSLPYPGVVGKGGCVRGPPSTDHSLAYWDRQGNTYKTPGRRSSMFGLVRNFWSWETEMMHVPLRQRCVATRTKPGPEAHGDDTPVRLFSSTGPSVVPACRVYSKHRLPPPAIPVQARATTTPCVKCEGLVAPKFASDGLNDASSSSSHTHRALRSDLKFLRLRALPIKARTNGQHRKLSLCHLS